MLCIIRVGQQPSVCVTWHSIFSYKILYTPILSWLSRVILYLTNLSLVLCLCGRMTTISRSPLQYLLFVFMEVSLDCPFRPGAALHLPAPSEQWPGLRLLLLHPPTVLPSLPALLTAGGGRDRCHRLLSGHLPGGDRSVPGSSSAQQLSPRSCCSCSCSQWCESQELFQQRCSCGWEQLSTAVVGLAVPELDGGDANVAGGKSGDAVERKLYRRGGEIFHPGLAAGG